MKQKYFLLTPSPIFPCFSGFRRKLHSSYSHPQANLCGETPESLHFQNRFTQLYRAPVHLPEEEESGR